MSLSKIERPRDKYVADSKGISRMFSRDKYGGKVKYEKVIDLVRPSFFLVSLFIYIAVQSLSVAGLSTFAYAQPIPGDALVIDRGAGTGQRGALFSVNLTPGPNLGDRTLISDFGDNTQGPLGFEPAGLTTDGSGDALVTDVAAGTGQNGALFSVDFTPGPTFGFRTLISDFGDNTQGPLGPEPLGVIVDGSGNALVIDLAAGTGGLGGLFSVDLTPGPTFGFRTLISDFGDNTQGPLGENPAGLTLDSSGDALVTDADAGTGSLGALFSVDLTPGLNLGNRSLISNFGDVAQGPLGEAPFGVILDGSGGALVIDPAAGTGMLGGLFSVDLTPGLTLGDRTLISDFGDNFQGSLGIDPIGLTMDGAGNSLVIDPAAGTGSNGALFSVDLTPGATLGDRTLLSDFGDAVQGPTGVQPTGVALFSSPVVSCGDAAVPTTGCKVNGVADQPCVGTDGPDTIIGTSEDDVIVGLAGNDILKGRRGDDLICGDAGNDLILGNRGDDDLIGGDDDDIVLGGFGADILEGNAGDDKLFGNPQNDDLDGGPGSDFLVGGAGNDTCVNGEVNLFCN